MRDRACGALVRHRGCPDIAHVLVVVVLKSYDIHSKTFHSVHSSSSKEKRNTKRILTILIYWIISTQPTVFLSIIIITTFSFFLILCLRKLIHFNCRENLADKPERGERSDGTKEQQHGKTDQEHVAKVQHVGHEHATRLQGPEPKDGVDKGVDSRAATRKEGKPPPPVVFGAQLVVHQQDRRFGARDNQNEVDNQRETKDVVELVHPQTGHDEKEFHVGGGKGDDARQGHADAGIQQGRRGRNGARNRAGDGGELNGVRLVPKIGAQKDERHRHAAPHGRHDDHVQKGRTGRRLQEPENNVEKQKGSKGDARKQQGRHNGANLPLATPKALVQLAAHVARQHAAEHVKGQKGVHEGPAAGRRQETHRRKEDGAQGRQGQLRPGTQKDAVQHGVILRRPEDVGVHELPARFVHLVVAAAFFIRQSREGVVGGNVAAEVADQNGDHEEAQKEHHENGVGDGVPVHLRRHQVVFAEVNVPAGRPLHVALFPDDPVGVKDLFSGLDGLTGLNVLALQVDVAHGTGLEVLVHAFGGETVPGVSAFEFVFDGKGFDGKGDDAVAVFFGVVVNVDVDVVVNVGTLRGGFHESNGKPAGVALFHFTARAHANGRGGQVVDDPVVVVVVLDVKAQFGGLEFAQCDLTELLAVDFLEHVDNVGRILNFVAREEFTEIFRSHFGSALGLAKGQAVVIAGNLRVRGSERVDLHGDLTAFLKTHGLHTGYIKCLCR